MHTSIFITGTSTSVGKTLAASLLMYAAHHHAFNPVYFKPIQTGADDDCATVTTLTQLADHHVIKPIYSFALPAAPYAAALAENKSIDCTPIAHQLNQLGRRCCMVEGAGGLLVPIAENRLMRDLIIQLNLPILIVASTQLGTINHTLLTIESALAKGIVIKGIILSGAPHASSVDMLQRFTTVPIIAVIPQLPVVSVVSMREVALSVFSKPLLKRIFYA